MLRPTNFFPLFIRYIFYLNPLPTTKIKVKLPLKIIILLLFCLKKTEYVFKVQEITFYMYMTSFFKISQDANLGSCDHPKPALLSLHIMKNQGFCSKLVFQYHIHWYSTLCYNCFYFCMSLKGFSKALLQRLFWAAVNQRQQCLSGTGCELALVNF